MTWSGIFLENPPIFAASKPHKKLTAKKFRVAVGAPIVPLFGTNPAATAALEICADHLCRASEPPKNAIGQKKPLRS